MNSTTSMRRRNRMTDRQGADNQATGSDEHIDRYCELCIKDKKRKIAAAGFCEECNLFICRKCLNAHFKWPRMRNHKIRQGKDMPRTKNTVSKYAPVSCVLTCLGLLCFICTCFLVFWPSCLQTPKQPCNISKIALTRTSSVAVKQSNDKENVIVGMVVDANGTLLLTDYSNAKLMAFANDGTFLSSLSFSDYPLDIMMVNSTTAVASTEDRTLNFLNISNPSDILLQSPISLGYAVTRMTMYNNKLFVIVKSPNGYSVKMLDLDGNEIWSTSSDSKGQRLFEWPRYLITKIINATLTVIVTDYEKNKVMFLDVNDGKHMNTIDLKAKGPAGLAVDKDDNVYIGYWKTSEISVWLPDFSKNRILLSNTVLQMAPRNIAYREGTEQLYISYFSASKVDRFNVTCG